MRSNSERSTPDGRDPCGREEAEVGGHLERSGSLFGDGEVLQRRGRKREGCGGRLLGERLAAKSERKGDIDVFRDRF